MSGGCPNCESYLFLSGRFDQVQECTSAIFEGIITLVDPEHSWVAKWQRLEGYVPGTYAVKVIGVVSLTSLIISPHACFSFFSGSEGGETGKMGNDPLSLLGRDLQKTVRVWPLACRQDMLI